VIVLVKESCFSNSHEAEALPIKQEKVPSAFAENKIPVSNVVKLMYGN
jgi:hypothetical protein